MSPFAISLYIISGIPHKKAQDGIGEWGHKRSESGGICTCTAHIMYAYEYMISCIAGKWKRLSHVCSMLFTCSISRVVWFASPLALRIRADLGF
jgi:hypothetical protein